ATRFRPLLLISCSALFLILFFMNLGRVCVMPKRIDANFNQYGWENDFWFRNAFYGDTQKYKEIMGGKYDQTMESAATAVSPDHQRIKIMVGSVFQNQSITHRNIGIIFEGFSAWVNDLDWKIAGFPAFLKYSPLVDNASLKTNKNAYFMKEHVCVPSEELDKMKKAPLDKKIVVLTRQDLRVFIFVHSQDAPNIINEYIARTPYTITLRKKGEVVELEGLEIKNYSEIPLDKIKQNFFFVVQNLYQGGR
ncbi:MAG TPA: hypothetical protein VMD04_06230, partial [Candidatus Margulisiibacteriota bacterium]|nr:hypothetical protein [Candidatus Margulisiibacteriota bacterium]